MGAMGAVGAVRAMGAVLGEHPAGVLIVPEDRAGLVTELLRGGLIDLTSLLRLQEAGG